MKTFMIKASKLYLVILTVNTSLFRQ